MDLTSNKVISSSIKPGVSIQSMVLCKSVEYVESAGILTEFDWTARATLSPRSYTESKGDL